MMASSVDEWLIRFGCSDFDHTMGAGVRRDISEREYTSDQWQIGGVDLVGFEEASPPGPTPVCPPVRPRFGLGSGFRKCLVCFRNRVRYVIFSCLWCEEG